jgi:hypothetical protein
MRKKKKILKNKNYIYGLKKIISFPNHKIKSQIGKLVREMIKSIPKTEITKLIGKLPKC